MNNPKPIIGLCGGVGAGKSTVAEEFARLGGLVINSDRLNHEVLREPEVVAELASWWGPEVVAADGGPERGAIARRVFEDAVARKRLESLVHPLIAKRRNDMISRGLDNPAVKAIILDSPLLFESQLDRLCEAVVYVEARDEQRLARVKRTRGWDQHELDRRERWQLKPTEKRSRAQYLIDNTGSRDELRSRVFNLFREIVGGRDDT